MRTLARSEIDASLIAATPRSPKSALCWIYLPPSLAAGLAARCQPRVVRSSAARARPVHQPARAAKAPLHPSPGRLPHAAASPPPAPSASPHQCPDAATGKRQPRPQPIRTSSTSDRQRASYSPTGDPVPLATTAPAADSHPGHHRT